MRALLYLLYLIRSNNIICNITLYYALQQVFDFWYINANKPNTQSYGAYRSEMYDTDQIIQTMQKSLKALNSLYSVSS